MAVVGVDFGTTNVRIAVRDSGDPDLTPRPLAIGRGEDDNRSFTMPAVIAFLQQPGHVTTVVGEDADGLADGPDTVVVRNIKRWALSSDPFVKWHLDVAQTECPNWWNEETRCVKAFGEEFPVWDVIRQILGEAFRRARQDGLPDEFEWRAGCPVQADWEYRSELAKVLSEFGGENKVTSVIEEPVLFLMLAYNLDTLRPGSYLVYDLGGGSFDCALVEVVAGQQMTVYASHGHPLLGGDRIDEMLARSLDAPVPRNQLRVAKESLSPDGPQWSLPGDISISWGELTALLERDMFIQKTRVVMREAYISAKVIWKHDENAPTLGGSAIPSCRLGRMASAFTKDLDAIILTGGPTKSPYFGERLTEIFGADRVKDAEDLIDPSVLDPNMDPKLTGISLGACYVVAENPSPLYVRRLPVRITLRDTATGASVEYQPYQHFVRNFSPASPFLSPALPSPAGTNAKCELTISSPEGTVLLSRPFSLDRRTGDKGPRLLIDTLGRIGIDFADGPPQLVIDDPPWQTDQQREILRETIARRQERERSEKERASRMITDNLYGWQIMPG